MITSYYEVRKNLENKSLYVGEINIDNILNLTNSDITDIMGIDYSRFTIVSNDFNRIQKAEVYKYTNLVGNQAFDAGYNGVLFNSSRNLSENNQVILLFDGRYKLDHIKKIIDERINREKKNDQDKKIKSREIGVIPAFIQGKEDYGFIFFLSHSSPVVGCQCLICNTIIRVDTYKNKIFLEKTRQCA